MHVYLQERVEVKPGQQTAYLEHLEANWHTIESSGPRCLGVWHTASTYGRWGEVFFLWEFDDWTHYGETMTSAYSPGGLLDWTDRDWQYRLRGEGLTLEPVPKCPSLSDLKDSHVNAGLFIHEYIRVAPGKRAEYVAHYLENFLPATRRSGRELIGIWSLTGCANDVLIILGIQDWEAHAYSMTNRTKDSDRQSWQASAPGFRMDYDLRLLIPGPRRMNPLSNR